MNWIELTETAALSEVIANTSTKPCIIFKNSTTCYISKMALRNFERSFTNPTEVACYMVDVKKNRLVSLDIADRFQAQHESPQLLIIADGKVVFHTSHEGIDGVETEKLLLRL
ncbi:bacillithiol system redox-active protein YtxJ [Myroides odoratus]|uniref:Bacillithiol system protein YtxJ n=1 Tax=Myroides odoratus TaxID=256 RepID=A0A378RM83_MYROD|nr:bacillithiol system redox-active protein YtxJ [Myroides odoratus]QQU05211.1 bacillithiol system redox-active protein YtxJ [Myroides odoratus]STZ27297.1 bacillithiol system protein YtxJ [Myroides odoratus]